MMRFSDMTIKARLFIMVAATAVGLTVVLGLTVWILHQYRVNGPVYEHLMQRMGVLSEIEPATFQLTAPYFTLERINAATEPGRIKQLKADFVAEKLHYQKRKEYWEEKLTEGPVHDNLTQQVFPAGSEFFRLAEEEYLPIAEKGDPQQARQVFTSRIQPAYEANKKAADETLEKGQNAMTEDERNTTESVHFWLITMIVVSVAAVAVSAFSGWFLARSIVRPTGGAHPAGRGNGQRSQRSDGTRFRHLSG